jgi:type 1 glutamine amidotransferase
MQHGVLPGKDRAGKAQAQEESLQSDALILTDVREAHFVDAIESFTVKPLSLLALSCALWLPAAGVVFEGKRGPGKGKHIVLVSGDEEYRSEEALPQLARILAEHHGFKCTVLFAIDPDTGLVNPDRRDNIPGLEALATADLMVMMLRFRDLPDDQMKHIADYVNAGKPIVALRTSTHAFAPDKNKTWQRWHWKEPTGGFGRMILGETWISHHGAHAKQSTRGIIAPGKANSPLLRGIGDGEVWGPSDVYTAKLPAGDRDVLLFGQVLTGMDPKDPPLPGPKNDPMMPVAWTRPYTAESGKTGRVFTTTMGSSQDLQNEAFRRLMVNAVYWGAGLENKIPKKAKVDIVGDYKPTPFKFGGYTKGRKPEQF